MVNPGEIFNFAEIKFGFAEAEIEGAREPQLLLDGFLDPNNAVRRIREGYDFLVLGYKGSGKSSIGEHLRLLSANDPFLFVSLATVSDFPFSDFDEIVCGGEDSQSRLPTAWSWLILIRIMDLLSKDEGAKGGLGGEFRAALGVLKSLGLLADPELKKIAKTSSSPKFKLQIPMIIEGSIEVDRSNSETRIPLFVERLKQIVSRFNSDSKHFLVIDGLDDILTQREIQFEALAALVLEVSRLNLLFERNGCPIKIVLLCRTDLFERIPGANKNKVRQDSSIILDWYHDPKNPGSSLLEKLSLKRANLVYPKLRNLHGSFFPDIIHGKPVSQFLFELTRHTPRDYLRLLSYIQKYATNKALATQDVLSGTREYSINYFLPEIKDELVGYIEHQDAQKIFDAMGSLRKREFSYMELRAQVSGGDKDVEVLNKALQALFECSAIGNIQYRGSRYGRGVTHYTFKYRNAHATLNLDERLALHKGMWKAMNLV